MIIIYNFNCLFIIVPADNIAVDFLGAFDFPVTL